MLFDSWPFKYLAQAYALCFQQNKAHKNMFYFDVLFRCFLIFYFISYWTLHSFYFISKLPIFWTVRSKGGGAICIGFTYYLDFHFNVNISPGKTILSNEIETFRISTNYIFTIKIKILFSGNGLFENKTDCKMPF